jgi:hypothetical protein
LYMMHPMVGDPVQWFFFQLIEKNKMDIPVVQHRILLRKYFMNIL